MAKTADNPGPAFVLVRPQMGENIGAAARAMFNFGHTRMRLVAPRDGWPNPAAVAMASGAGRILDSAATYPTLGDAVADCTHVYATTVRPRDLTKRVLTPQAAALEIAARQSAGERVAILFGPERAGLENDDVAVANTIVTAPTNPDFPSLNLAQSVLLMAYECAGAAGQGDQPQADGPDLATQVEVAHLGDHYDEVLTRAGFFFPETKAAHMRLNLRNLWSRMPLTRGDVQILHGMLRQLVRRMDGR